MNKPYVPYEPDQQLLLPAALQEWLPDDHLAYFISDVVDQLDMSKVTAGYERERRGGPPYHPRMMVKVLLYGYCVGVASSRRIAQRLHEDIAFRVLAANNTPDFRTISDFRKDNVDALSGLFVQVLALCQQAGLVKLGHVALDGTKVEANASKHKAMSYQRMKEKAAQLAAEVAELLRQAQAADDEEDRRYGKDKRGDELPEELAFRERRLEEIREGMAALEAEAQAAAEQAEAEGGKHPGVPDDKAQRGTRRLALAAAKEPGEIVCEGLTRAGRVASEPLYVVSRLLGETVFELGEALRHPLGVAHLGHRLDQGLVGYVYVGHRLVERTGKGIDDPQYMC